MYSRIRRRNWPLQSCKDRIGEVEEGGARPNEKVERNVKPETLSQRVGLQSTSQYTPSDHFGRRWPRGIASHLQHSGFLSSRAILGRKAWTAWPTETTDDKAEAI